MMSRSILLVFTLIIWSKFADAQFDKYESPDSLFKSYQLPEIDKAIYSKLENDDAIAYFICFLTTDTSGRISSRKILPLYDVGNHYSDKDSVWKSISDAIEFASRKWILKTYSWRFSKNDVLRSKINLRSLQRPFEGKPKVLLIFQISPFNGTFIDKISFVNSFDVLK